MVVRVQTNCAFDDDRSLESKITIHVAEKTKGCVTRDSCCRNGGQNQRLSVQFIIDVCLIWTTHTCIMKVEFGERKVFERLLSNYSENRKSKKNNIRGIWWAFEWAITRRLISSRAWENRERMKCFFGNLSFYIDWFLEIYPFI